MAANWHDRMGNGEELRPLLEHVNVRPGSIVLDLGCGTGRMANILKKMVAPGGQIIAMDIAEQMLIHGRKLNTSETIQWLCSDGETCGLKSKSIDKVICFSTFPHFKSPDIMFNEMGRILKPGGRLVILHNVNSTVLNTFHSKLDSVVKNDYLPPADQLAATLKRRGFDIIRVVEDENLYCVEGQRILEEIPSSKFQVPIYK